MSESSPSEEASKTSRRQRGRSPSYPSISLPRALARANELWQSDRQYETPADAVARNWGYAGLNGPAGLALAAMKKFGLLEDEGTKSSRVVRLTDLAIKALNHPDAAQRANAIRVAALTPPIHRELWEEFGSALPSEKNLTWRLTFEKGFTESGAREFMREYRETIEFADLISDDQLEPMSDDDEPAVDDGGAAYSPTQASPLPANLFDRIFGAPSEPAPTVPLVASTPVQQTDSQLPIAAADPIRAANRQVKLPLPSAGDIVLDGPFPLSESQWNYLMAVLSAMKPGLVRDEE